MNIKDISNWVDQHALWVHAICMCLKHKNDIEYQKDIVYKHKNPNIWKVETRGTDYPGIILCDINPVNKEHGFFAGFRYTLDALYFADFWGLTPIVHYGKNSKYFDREMPEEVDPFNYYFLNTSKYTVTDLQKAQNVLVYKPNHQVLAEQLCRGNIGGYEISEQFIDTLGRIMARYIHFQPNVEKYLSEGIVKNNINN